MDGRNLLADTGLAAPTGRNLLTSPQDLSNAAYRRDIPVDEINDVAARRAFERRRAELRRTIELGAPERYVSAGRGGAEEPENEFLARRGAAERARQELATSSADDPLGITSRLTQPESERFNRVWEGLSSHDDPRRFPGLYRGNQRLSQREIADVIISHISDRRVRDLPPAAAAAYLFGGPSTRAAIDQERQRGQFGQTPVATPSRVRIDAAGEARRAELTRRVEAGRSREAQPIIGEGGFRTGWETDNQVRARRRAGRAAAVELDRLASSEDGAELMAPDRDWATPPTDPNGTNAMREVRDAAQGRPPAPAPPSREEVAAWHARRPLPLDNTAWTPGDPDDRRGPDPNLDVSAHGVEQRRVQREIARIRRERERTGYYNGIGGFFRGLGESGTATLMMTAGGVVGGVVDALGGEGTALSNMAHRESDIGAARMQLADPGYSESQNPLGFYLFHGGVAIEQMAGAITVGALTRNPAAMSAGIMGTQVAAQEYDDLRRKGYSPRAALAVGVLYGLAEAIPEKMALHNIFHNMQTIGGGALRRVAVGGSRAAAVEGLQETFTEVLQMGIDTGILNQNMTWDEAWTRIRQAGILGAITGGPIGAGGSGIGGSRRLARRAEMRQFTAPIRDGTWAAPADQVAANMLDPELRSGAIKPGYAENEDGVQVPVLPSDERSPIPTEDIIKGKEEAGLVDDNQSGNTDWIDQRQRDNNRRNPNAPQRPVRPAPVVNSDRARELVKARIRGSESGGNDRAENPRGTASGRYQFIKSTFLPLHRRVFGGNMSDSDRWAQRFDPQVQERLMDASLALYERAFRQAGVEVTPGNLYLAHFLGPSRAITALRNPNMPIEQIIGAAGVRANPFVRGMTAGQVAQWTAGRMGGRGGRGGRTMPEGSMGEVTPDVRTQEPPVPGAAEMIRTVLGPDNYDQVQPGVQVQVGQTEATVTDRFDHEGQPGVTLRMQDGTTQDISLTDLQARNAQITSPSTPPEAVSATEALNQPTPAPAASAALQATVEDRPDGSVTVRAEDSVIATIRAAFGNDVVSMPGPDGSVVFPARVAEQVRAIINGQPQEQVAQTGDEPIISPEQLAQVQAYAQQFKEGGDPTAVAGEQVQPQMSVGRQQTTQPDPFAQIPWDPHGDMEDGRTGPFLGDEHNTPDAGQEEDLSYLDRPSKDDYAYENIRPHPFDYTDEQYNQLNDEVARFQEHGERVLKALNLPAVLKATHRLRSIEPGTTLQGYHMRGLIKVAVHSAEDPSFILDHESIHALREAGAFTKDEWNFLVRHAKNDEALVADIQDRYKNTYLELGPKRRAEMLEEEMVADMFAMWRESRGDVLDADGRPIETPKTFIDRVFTKLSQIIYALKKAIGGNPDVMREAIRIMQQVEGGHIGGRITEEDLFTGKGRQFNMGPQASQTNEDAKEPPVGMENLTEKPPLRPWQSPDTEQREAPFYSALARAVEQSPAARAPAQQWIATLTKTPGVKQEELEWTGVIDWLKGEEKAHQESRSNQPLKIEKADVLAFVKNHGIQVFEKEKMPFYELVQQHSGMGGAFEEAVWAKEAEDRDEWVNDELNKIDFDARVPEIINISEHDPEATPPEGEMFADKPAHYEFDGEPFATFKEASAVRDARLKELEDEKRQELEEQWSEDDHGDAYNYWEQEAAQETGLETQWEQWSAHREDPRADDESYREVLMAIPHGFGGNPENKGGYGSHWQEPNVVAHARYHDTYDANDVHTRMLGEMQSDWHQSGKKRGYQRPIDPEQLDAARRKEVEAQNALTEGTGKAIEFIYEHGADEALGRRPFLEGDRPRPGSVPTHLIYNGLQRVVREARMKVDGKASGELEHNSDLSGPMTPPNDDVTDPAFRKIHDKAKELIKEIELAQLRFHEALNEVNSKSGQGIPDAPFKKVWPQLLMRRMIQKAVADGIDQIAWIRGEDQNGGRTGGGGDWFYGRDLVNMTNDIIKKYGSKVEPIKMEEGVRYKSDFTINQLREELQAIRDNDPDNYRDNPAYQETEAELKDALEDTSQHNMGFKITPELAAAAKGGFPMFSKAREQGGEPKPRREIQYSQTRRVSPNAFPDNKVEADYLSDDNKPIPAHPQGLNKADYDLFARKIMLDDFALMDPKDLPYGLNAESLSKARLKIEDKLSRNNKVRDAVRRHKFAIALGEAVDHIKPDDVLNAPPVDRDADGRPKAGNIRLDNLTTTEAIDKAMADIGRSQITGDRLRTVSQDETKKLAELMDMSVGDLLKNHDGRAFNAHEAFAARTLLVASADNLIELARKARNGSDADVVKFNTAWIRHVAIQDRVANITAEAGRTLNQFNMMAKAGGDLNVKLMKQIEEQADGKGRQDMVNIAKMILSVAEDPAKMNKLARDAFNPTWRDKLFELWINMLLSGPATHVVNFTSNLLTGLTRGGIEEPLAAGIGKVRSLFKPDTERMMGSEAMGRLRGMWQGAGEGVLFARDAWKNEEGRDVLSKLEARHQRSISGLKGKIVRLPGRALLASDEFFKGVAERMAINGLAARQASKEGLTGTAFDERVAELVGHPTQAMFDAALGEARYNTFTQPLGPTGQAITNFFNKIPGGRIIVPFMRTPMNIFKYAVERTPGAPLVLSETRENLKAGGIRRDQALARIAFGSSIMGMIWAMAAQGIITGGGGGPDEQRKRRLTGWQPYSIKIGDTYYSYNRLDPLSTIMGFTADLVTANENLTPEEAHSAGGVLFTSIMGQLQNKTFLSGLGNAIEALTDSDRYGPGFVAQMAGTIVPTGVAQLNNVIDPTVRDTRGEGVLESVWNRIKSRIPGLSQSLPARQDAFGQDITREGGVGLDIASPMQISTDRHDQVAEEIVRTNASLGEPNRKIRIDGRDVRMSNEDYSSYSHLAGQYAHEDLADLFDGEDYQSMTLAEKRNEIRRVVNAARRSARDELGIGEEPAQ